MCGSELRIQLGYLPSNKYRVYHFTRYLMPLISPVDTLNFVQPISAQLTNDISVVVIR
jgi:hypothetical protein